MLQDDIKQFLQEKGNQDILIHSDVLFGFKIKFDETKDMLQQHIQALQEVCGSLRMMMPAFNYDFCRGTRFDVNTAESQVGVLSEYFRTHTANWRSTTPVFNFSGTGECPIPHQSGLIDPFDDSSLFGYLDKNKGILMHYGSGFPFTTLIHYVERISGKLIYRYDKIFTAEVVDGQSNSQICQMKYHVRPMGFALDYDWTKLESDLMKAGILSLFQEKRSRILLARIDEIVAFWLGKLQEDPFYLLNAETRAWVEERFQTLQRPFTQSDFE